MRRPSSATLFVLAWSCAGCGSTSGSGSCYETFEYHATVDLSAAPRDSCTLVLSGGTQSATFTLSTLPELTDGQCTGESAAVELTAPGNAPRPDGYFVTPCLVSFDYSEPGAKALSQLVGAEVLTLTVVCGGQQVASQLLKPTRTACAL